MDNFSVSLHIFFSTPFRNFFLLFYILVSLISSAKSSVLLMNRFSTFLSCLSTYSFILFRSTLSRFFFTFFIFFPHNLTFLSFICHNFRNCFRLPDFTFSHNSMIYFVYFILIFLAYFTSYFFLFFFVLISFISLRFSFFVFFCFLFWYFICFLYLS